MITTKLTSKGKHPYIINGDLCEVQFGMIRSGKDEFKAEEVCDIFTDYLKDLYKDEADHIMLCKNKHTSLSYNFQFVLGKLLQQGD